MKIPNGAQLHEINKLIGTVTTVAVVGCVIYSSYQERKLAKVIDINRKKMKLVDAALDARDLEKFNAIVRKEYPKL
jgi:hypothetical protein